MATSPAMPTPIYDELLTELALALDDNGTEPVMSATDPAPGSES